MPHSTLSKDKAERLEMLAEEAGEIVQACMKILRHGYTSYHPKQPEISNRQLLGEEIGNLIELINLMVREGDVSADAIHAGELRKRGNLNIYAHHQKPI